MVGVVQLYPMAEQVYMARDPEGPSPTLTYICSSIRKGEAGEARTIKQSVLLAQTGQGY